MTLEKLVDASIFSLEDWQSAVTIFRDWCSVHHMAYQDEDMLGYLHCCSEAAAARPFSGSLSNFVSDMLKEFGFEAGRPL